MMRYVSSALLVLLLGCSKPPLDLIEELKDKHCLSSSARNLQQKADIEKIAQDKRFAMFRSYGRARDLYQQALDACSQITIPDPNTIKNSGEWFTVNQKVFEAFTLYEITNGKDTFLVTTSNYNQPTSMIRK